MSNKTTASEDKLGIVHDLMTEVALGILRATEKCEDGTVIALKPSAADMAWIRAFLKDNDITCAPGQDNAIGKLKEELAKQRAARQSPTGAAFNPATDLPDGYAIQ